MSGQAGSWHRVLLGEGRELSPSLVWAMAVVVPGVGVEDLPRVGLVPYQQVVGGLAPQRSDGSFAVGVRSRRTRRRLDDLHVLSLEDRIEGRGVLRVPVADQETQ